MYIQPFSMEVDWRQIWHQMGVSTKFYICEILRFYFVEETFRICIEKNILQLFSSHLISKKLMINTIMINILSIISVNNDYNVLQLMSDIWTHPVFCYIK